MLAPPGNAFSTPAGEPTVPGGVPWASSTTSVRARPLDLPRLAEVAADPATGLFTIGLTLATALLCGLLPALSRAGSELEPALREGAPGATPTTRSGRLRQILVAVEAALATVVVVGAGLMVSTFWHLERVDPGFRPQGLVSAVLVPPAAAYRSAAEVSGLYERVLEEVRALPGVESAGLVQTAPVSGGGWVMEVEPEGAEPAPGREGRGEAPLSYWRVVSPGYTRTLGMHRLAGRALEASDRAGAPEVALVDETAARRLWPGAAPREVVGRRVSIGFEKLGAPVTVVGVVADLAAAAAAAWLPARRAATLDPMEALK